MAEKNNTIMKKAVLIILLALPVSVYVLSVVLSGELNFRTLEILGPRELITDQDGEVDTLFYTVPEFSFVDQNHVVIDNEAMRGKIYAASFFFTTCPTVCPAMNFHLKVIHDRLNAYKDIHYISHTIDPDHDSIPVLKQYEKMIGAERTSKWHFVTGPKDDIFRMADAYFLAARNDSTQPGGYYHSQQVVLVDWEGRIRSRKDDNGNIIGAYDLGQAMDIDALVDDLRVLAKEYRKVKMEG